MESVVRHRGYRIGKGSLGELLRLRLLELRLLGNEWIGDERCVTLCNDGKYFLCIVYEVEWEGVYLSWLEILAILEPFWSVEIRRDVLIDVEAEVDRVPEIPVNSLDNLNRCSNSRKSSPISRKWFPCYL